MRKKKGKTVYAIISLVSLVVPIFGGITGTLSWWNSMNDKREYVRDTLRSSIQFGQDLLPSCNMTAEEKEQINNQLQRAENTLELRDDLETPRSILNSIDDVLISCIKPPPHIHPYIPPLVPDVNILEPTGAVIIWFIILVPVPAVVSLIYGLKWYRSRRVDVKDDQRP